MYFSVHQTYHQISPANLTMTRTPFSVEWLSQSSQQNLRQVNQSNFSTGLQPLEEDISQGGEVLNLDQEPSSDRPPTLQKEASSSSSSKKAPPAQNAPKGSGTECGSDGEGSQSSEDSAGRSRRLRTAFSLKQLDTLESSFKKHKYLGAAERKTLASKMQLSEVQIKTWFQNRRMKLKRQLQEMRPDSFHSTPFYSPLPYGPQSGPLYIYPPHQQTFPRREPFLSGIALPTMPAPTLDSISASAGQSGTLWPMQLPYYMGYQDPRTVFLTL